MPEGFREDKAFVLHYGGKEYEIPEAIAKLLDASDFTEPGSLTLNIGGGRRLTLVTGPGIPLAVLESTRRVKTF